MKIADCRLQIADYVSRVACRVPGVGRRDTRHIARWSLVIGRRLFSFLAIMLLIVLLQGSRQAHAQTPKKERAFVYGINAAFALTYLGTFAPDSASAIYLLADQTSVISPRITEIYFWPITNEYQADWNLVNEPVPGKLEILRGGQLLSTVDPTKYSIQFTPRGMSADAKLYLGAEAEQAQAQFIAKQQAYQQASSEYVEAQRQWTAAVDAAVAQRAAGKSFTPPPPQPQPPAPIDTYSNGLNDGFPINLTPGNYQIQVRGLDGTIAPQSRRDLVVFAPRRVAVGYTVVPETRWTTPDQVTDLSDAILGQPGSNLYLQPHVIREYPARAYALLQNPQAHGVQTSEWTWVGGEPLNDDQLQIVVGDQVADQRALTPYRVEQLADTALGYQVQPYVPGNTSPSNPDFVAYPIQLDTSGAAYSVRLISPQGTLVAGSTRLVRVPAQIPFSLLLPLPAVPLLVGAFVVLRRRRRMRLPRDVVK